MRFLDRLLTIIVTATLTSAVWIVIGSGWVTQRQPVGEDRVVAEAVGTGGAASASVPLAGRLAIPVAGITATDLSDTFTDERGAGGQDDHVHEALDIMAPAGTPVIAAAPGRVERLFASRAGGNTVYVRSPDGRVLHYYAHLQNYAPGLVEGQQVTAGQPLGTVGASGNADPGAPHLHFAILRTTPDAEWWEPARAVNPYPLLGGQ